MEGSACIASSMRPPTPPPSEVLCATCLRARRSIVHTVLIQRNAVREMRMLLERVSWLVLRLLVVRVMNRTTATIVDSQAGMILACPGEDQTEEEEKHEFVDVDCNEDHDVSPESEGSNKRQDYMNRGKDAVLTRLHENRHCRKVLKVCSPPRRIVPGQETLTADVFGKIIHLDHVFAGSECHGVNGVNGETCTLVILDQYTGFIGTYPMTERTGPHVVSVIRHFLGEDVSLAQVGVRVDNAKEYEFATRALGLAWYKSTPHRHQGNGKIERCIRSVCEMTRCILVQSGLSCGHWPYTMDHAAMMRNGNARRGNKVIEGNEKQGISKFEANSREAIFLGYEFAPGCVHADYSSSCGQATAISPKCLTYTELSNASALQALLKPFFSATSILENVSDT
eukprot:6273106-Amphidinium_carterae.2